MRRLLVPFLCLLAVAAKAETREFRSRDMSKSFRGEFLGYDPTTTKVRVKTDAGATLEFPVTALCEEDQKWAKENATQWRMRIEPKEIVGKEQLVSKGTREIAKRDLRYDVTVTNLERADLDNATINYQIVYRREEIREGRVQSQLLLHETTSPLELVAPGKKNTLASPAMTLNSNKPGKCMSGG